MGYYLGYFLMFVAGCHSILTMVMLHKGESGYAATCLFMAVGCLVLGIRRAIYHYKETD